MNTKTTKNLVEELKIRTLRADKSQSSENKDEVDQMLLDLGNKLKQIPFLAIYPADGRDPIILPGPIVQSDVVDALQQAGPSAATVTVGAQLSSK